MENERERAIKAISAFLEREYGDAEIDESADARAIPVIYSTDGDGEHELQWYADIVAMELWVEIDGERASYRERLDIDYFESGDDVFDYYIGIAEDILAER